jgi:hypothetical protein
LPQRSQFRRELYEVLLETVEAGAVPTGAEDRRRARSEGRDVRSEPPASTDRRRQRDEIGDRQRHDDETGAGRGDGRELPCPVTRDVVADPEREDGVPHEVQPVDEIGRHSSAGLAHGAWGDAEDQRPPSEDHGDPDRQDSKHDRHPGHRQPAVRRAAPMYGQRRSPESVGDPARQWSRAAPRGDGRPSDVHQCEQHKSNPDEDRSDRHGRGLPRRRVDSHGHLPAARL